MRVRRQIPLFLCRKARIADRDNGNAQLFTVTHPFHPLKGQSFEILVVRKNWDEDRVSYLGAEGRLRTLPIEWTDIRERELIVRLGAGRAVFRADLLRQLRAMINEIAARKGAQ